MLKRIIMFTSFLNILNCINCSAATVWTAPATIAGSQGAVGAAVARDAAGNTLVAWQAITGNNSVVRTSYYNASYNYWSSIKELGSAYIKSNLYVSMNADGHGIIAWLDSNQIVTTVSYAKEDWQSWQPVPMQLSGSSDRATELYMPQIFNSITYVAWIDSAGININSYSLTSSTWSTTKRVAKGTCNTLLGATDALDNLMLVWLEVTDNNSNRVCANRYKTTQTWDLWIPFVTELSQSTNNICPCVAISNPAAQSGTAIFMWIDKQGLQTTLYTPDLSWQAWQPSDYQKTMAKSAWSHTKIAMDPNGNALFTWQASPGYCQYSYYAASQSWKSWSPTAITILENPTIINDSALYNTQQGILMLTSLGTNDLDTIYIALVDGQGYIDIAQTIAHTCIPSTQKTLALKQNSSTFDAIVVWPSVPSKGVLYLSTLCA